MAKVYVVGSVVLCFLFCLAVKGDSYKVGLVNLDQKFSSADEIQDAVNNAAELNLDILLVPFAETETSSYEEMIKSYSDAAKRANVYLVADLEEKKKCSGKNELVRSNIVLDRNGEIVSIYRKPVDPNANCNMTFTKPTKFSTDFGVDFVQLFDEDLALMNVDGFKDVRNFIVSGSSRSAIQLLNGNQFAAPWAFVNEANVISSKQIIGGSETIAAHNDNIVAANVNKYGASGYLSFPPMVKPSSPTFPGEDLSQFVIRPLDTSALKQGLKETVCHGEFCCQFYIKASSIAHTDKSYGLAVFEGIRHYGNGYNIGTQNCALLACATLYKRSCDIGHEDNIQFEEVSITGNFAKENSAQYPVFVSTLDLPEAYHKIKMYSQNLQNHREIVMKLYNTNNVLSFGIFGRDYTKDSKVIDVVKGDFDFYDYIYNDDVVELFDYLWIRVRILFVVVSIYVLEMM